MTVKPKCRCCGATPGTGYHRRQALSCALCAQGGNP